MEFSSGAALEALGSLLPCVHTDDAVGISCYIQTLASVYTHKVGSSTTESYLNEIKKLAKLSGV